MAYQLLQKDDYPVPHTAMHHLKAHGFRWLYDLPFSYTGHHDKELRPQMRSKHRKAQWNTLFVIPSLVCNINCPNTFVALSSLHLKYNSQNSQQRRYLCHKKHREIYIYHESLPIQASR